MEAIRTMPAGFTAKIVSELRRLHDEGLQGEAHEERLGKHSVWQFTTSVPAWSFQLAAKIDASRKRVSLVGAREGFSGALACAVLDAAADAEDVLDRVRLVQLNGRGRPFTGVAIVPPKIARRFHYESPALDKATECLIPVHPGEVWGEETPAQWAVVMRETDFADWGRSPTPYVRSCFRNFQSDYGSIPKREPRIVAMHNVLDDLARIPNDGRSYFRAVSRTGCDVTVVRTSKGFEVTAAKTGKVSRLSMRNMKKAFMSFAAGTKSFCD